MECRRCRKPMPDVAGLLYCPYCGAKQEIKKPKSKRPNATGTAYPRGKTWTARIVLGYYSVEDPKHPGKRILRRNEKTKGGFRTKTEALAYCKVLGESAGVPIAGRKITLKELFDEWEPIYSHRVSEGTMKSHKAAFQWLKGLWGYNFSDISAAQLQTAIDACPRKRRTKEDIKCLLSALYKYGIQNDYAQKSRADFLYCGEDDGRARQPLSMEEVERIAGCGLPYADYILCLVYTGFRPNELLGLKKEDYDAEHRMFIRGFKTAAGTDRHIPVSPKIQSIIGERMAQAGEWLFPDQKTGERMSDEQFRVKCFNPVMEALGIEGKVPYSCRHTFSNLLKNAVGSDKDKAALMGHADYSTTKRKYQSAEDEKLREIIEQM